MHYPPTPQRKACDCSDPCISTDDVYYAGPNLPYSGINTYNVLTEVIEKLDAIYSFPTLQKVTETGNYTTLPIIADSFVKIGGDGTNILLDNGTVIPISSIVSNPSIVTKTKAEIDTLISGNDLVPLTVYEITGVDTSLYGGSTIYLQAINDNTLATDGYGKFYNPKYDQSVSGFDVWTSAGTYSIGDKVHWGGKTWENVDGNVGASTDLFTLDSEWSVIAFNDTDYNVAYDLIKYDYNNDVIVYRNEQNSNIVSTNYDEINWNIGINPIKAFMWGNIFDYAISKGIGNQIINNSYNENINFRGSFQIYLTFNNGSYQQNITFDNGSYQQFLNFNNNSYQQFLNFDNGSNQIGLNFNNGSFQIYLTEITGLRQLNISFNNYQFDRTSTPLTANEIGLIFNGTLPTSTTATKMIVAEDGQWKEMDVPTTPYKSYTALLTQTEENDPVATILENTIGDIVWTRLGAGSYLATSDNLFTENKTTIFMTGNSSLVFGIYPSINTPGTEITVETGSPNETHLDQILDNTPIEIRVYN